MLYLFILGRNPELSKIEVESILKNFKIKDESNNVLVVESDKLNPEIINEFGGIIKIAEVISSSSSIEYIENDLEKTEIYKGTRNKIQYYIDHFNTNLLSFMEDYLKDYFKTIKVKALYKRTKEPSKINLEKELNFVIFKNYIGKVISISNTLEFKR